MRALKRIELAFFLLCIFIQIAQAQIVPHGISGYVLELDGLTEVSEGTHFSINNSASGFYMEGTTGRPYHTGKYAAAVKGSDGDTILLKAWNEMHETSRTVMLDGVMTDVNLYLNTSLPIHPPVVTSDPVLEAYEDSEYLYQVVCTDPDEDLLDYALAEAPTGMTINSSGLVGWLPLQEDIGHHDVIVSITDGFYTINHTYDLIVHEVNDPPVLEPVPSLEAVEDVLFTYTIVAYDEENDTLLFMLLDAPPGMAINSSSGLISWVPDDADAGVHPFTVRVEDMNGGFDNVSTVVSVTRVDDPPVFLSIPPVHAVQDEPYTYVVDIFDEEGADWSLVMDKHPAGMLWNPASSALSWTPSYSQVGANPVVVNVSDGYNVVIQSFVVNVSNVNDLPVITSTPDTTCLEDDVYLYNLTASDYDNDTLVYTVVAGPSSMVINSSSGQLRWMPTNDDVGFHNITLSVSDSSGHVEQGFFLEVIGVNDAPVITSTPVTAGIQDQTYLYDVDAIDIDGPSLAYILVQKPEGMVIDTSSGIIVWTPDAYQVGTHEIMVIVNDSMLYATQRFTLIVENVNDPPVIHSSPPAQAIVWSEYVYSINASDIDHDDLIYSLIAAPVGMEIENNVISWVPLPCDIGSATVIVEVSDGELAVTQEFTVEVLHRDQCLRDCNHDFIGCLSDARDDYYACVFDAQSVYESCIESCEDLPEGYACRFSCRSENKESRRACYEGFREGKRVCAAGLLECAGFCRGNRISAVQKPLVVNIPDGTELKVASGSAVRVVLPSERPKDADPPGASVYRYVDIEKLDPSVEGAAIRFSVKREWLIAHNLKPEDVVLRRYHDYEWQLLPTRIIAEQDDLVLYESSTEGFSHFAISSRSEAGPSPARSHDSLPEFVTVSGFLLEPDGTQVNVGTSYIIINQRTGRRNVGVTGIGPYPGAFFEMVEGVPGDEVRIEVEGRAGASFDYKDIDLARFTIDDTTDTVRIEEPVSDEPPSGPEPALMPHGNAVRDLPQEDTEASSLLVMMLLLSCIVFLVWHGQRRM